MSTEKEHNSESIHNESVTEQPNVCDETDKVAEKSTKNDTTEVNLSEELAALQDRFLRLAAEYDNYQKRTQKERLELIKNAGERTIKAFLPVVDDFNRMLLILEKEETLSDVVKEGFTLIQQKFVRILSELGVKEIQAIGQKFDSAFHEAVGELPAQNEEQKGIVLAEVEKGYFLHDKVLRYSKVLIGK
ncbi:MAG: nucleotide exchange factor GrpE [Bacteroidia bacterium]|nr:nucleotide exchange factor GrpE [Bacteroidia bacterium]MDW8348333.1 nucleotide exchange factor GrpE [Bacteroidia bacterium]